MRHGVKLNHLGRTSAHRKALLSGLASDLILHKRLITTLAKAKALRVYVEPLLTKSKDNTTHQRRVVFSYLEDKEAVKELFSVVSEKIAARPGGYTRVIKLGTRLGDAAEMAMIELVDFNDLYTNQAPDAGKKKRTRRSSGAKKKTAESVAAETKGTTDEVEAEENKKEAASEGNKKEEQPEA